MHRDQENRELLLEFLDKKAFDPILEAMPELYSTERDRRYLEDVQRSAAVKKEHFHRECLTAREIVNNYMQDLSNETISKLGKELEDLELPRLWELRSQFIDLCSELGIN